MQSLTEAVRRLPAPRDYFAGIGEEPWCWPRNLLAFARHTRRDLQRRTFESRLHGRHVLAVNLMTPAVLNLDGAPYPLRPGQAHLVFPHQFHTYHDVESERICWLFVTFEMPEAGALDHLRHSSVTLDPGMLDTLQQFLALYPATTNQFEQQRLQALLASLIARVAEAALDRPHQPSPRRPGAAALLARIRSLHDSALPDAISIPQLAARLNISEGRLRALFRESFGMSLGHYLRRHRLHEAVAMMRHSEASLTQIALSCGFSSSATFSRAFKTWAGVTPRSFRKDSGARG